MGIDIELFFIQLHTSTYKAGVYYYSEGEWEKSVQYFEKAASDFITAEQECR